MQNASISEWALLDKEDEHLHRMILYSAYPTMAKSTEGGGGFQRKFIGYNIVL